jgi:hypothetical protein
MARSRFCERLCHRAIPDAAQRRSGIQCLCSYEARRKAGFAFLARVTPLHCCNYTAGCASLHLTYFAADIIDRLIH